MLNQGFTNLTNLINFVTNVSIKLIYLGHIFIWPLDMKGWVLPAVESDCCAGI